MKIEVDTHSHTIPSGHAYSTLIENSKVAQEKGLKILCATEHAPSMLGAPNYWFFNNQRILPRFLNGVGIIRGIEANIMDEQGTVDIHPSSDELLDWVIASFHEYTYPPTDKRAHTAALIHVIESGRVDALGHLGNPNYDFDIEKVAQCAKNHNVAIELNNSSLKGNSRPGSEARCEEIARAVHKVGGFITTGSDAHFCLDVGGFDKVFPLIERVGIPSEKIITHSTRQFLSFLQLRGRQPIAEFKELSER